MTQISQSSFSDDNIANDDNLLKVSVRSKKEEILSAYQELMIKFQKNAEKSKDRESVAIRNQENEIVGKAEKHSVSAISKNAAELENSFKKWLNDLISSLEKEAQKLQEVRDAIIIQEKYLSEIHQIKAEAETLSSLIQAHNEKKEELESEYKKQMEKLTAEIEEKKKEWKREQEEYDYELNLKRKKDENEYQQKRLVKEQELEKREIELVQQKNELEELRQLKELFNEKLEEEVANAQKEATQKTKYEEEVKAKILAEKIAAEKKIAEMTIESLKRRINDQDMDISCLKKELEIANHGVKDIAIEVIKGRSAEHRSLKTYEEENKSEKDKKVAA